jgi:peroxiredoxin
MQQKNRELEIGRSVPPLNVRDLNDNPLKIDYQVSHRKTIIFVFSLNCPQCLVNIPYWRKLKLKLQNKKNYKILAVVRDKIESVRQYVDGYQLTYPIYVINPADNVLSEGYGVNFVPTTLIIDGNGKIQDGHVGTFDDENIERFIADL